MKKLKNEKAQFVIQNCTFHGAQPSSEADIKRSEAVKAIADALSKAAEALVGPANNIGLMIKGSDKPD
jgi:hypothetical protein